jgi:hypothetical protein
MKNTITDLRNHLFATIEALRDQENPMEIDRAKAVSEVAREITNLGRLELQFMDHTGSMSSGFIPDPVALMHDTRPRLVK